MALLISHRGNINGINKKLENTPEYIKNTLDKGYYVMVDVFLVGERFLAMGCESPEHGINVDFLKNERIIAKARSIECFDFLLTNQIHTFYHDHDACSLTSGGLIWTRPGSNITQRCIFNMPEWIMSDITEIKDINCAGICSDKIEEIKNTRSSN